MFFVRSRLDLLCMVDRGSVIIPGGTWLLFYCMVVYLLVEYPRPSDRTA